jgi:undecaprenyl-diphosphatase
MNLNIWQVMLLALLQGLTELFPVSSLGHTVVLPGLLPGLFGANGHNLVTDQNFLPLIVALHLGTSIALVIYFWRIWFQVLRTLFKNMKEGEFPKVGTEDWVSWLIIIGCIPAGVLGAFLESPLKHLFASPLIAASFLIVNGSLLFAGERIRLRGQAQYAALPPKEREAHFRTLASLTWKEAIIVGFAQALALIPGISRSGATMVAGLGVRLNHEDAARYSFLLGTPIIGAAALIEVPQLFGQPAFTLLIVAIGMVVAGVAAFLSTKFLMKYFETGRLDPFAYYCWIVGVVSLILLIFVFHNGLS